MPKKNLNKPAVFVGNLNTNLRAKELCQHIIQLFDYIGLTVKKRNISVITRRYAKFAFVSFGDDRTVLFAVEKLQRQNDVPETLLSNLVEPSLRLKVDKKWNTENKTSSSDYNHGNESEDDIDIIDDLDPRYKPLPSADNEEDFTSMRLQHKQSPARVIRHDRYDEYNNMVPSTSGQTSNQRHETNPHLIDHAASGAYSDSVLIQQQGGNKAKAIAGKKEPKSYVLGKHLGNETRCVEFKAGQGDYKKNNIHNHVGKYITAFLNSEGGTLIIGVNDQGIVQGLLMNHLEEDQTRLKVDSAITGIKPQVFPDMYSVSFVPVVDVIGNIIPNLKVVEINVEKGLASDLYQNIKGEAYLRWDGSVQGPLSASSIQEHTKKRLLEESQRKEHELRNMEIKQEHLLKDQRELQSEIKTLNKKYEQTLNTESREKEKLELELKKTKHEKQENDQKIQVLSERLKDLEVQQERKREEVKELEGEKQEWMLKAAKKQKSKTCIVS